MGIAKLLVTISLVGREYKNKRVYALKEQLQLRSNLTKYETFLVALQEVLYLIVLKRKVIGPTMGVV